MPNPALRPLPVTRVTAAAHNNSTRFLCGCSMYLSLGLESALVSTIGPAFTASSLAFAQPSGWFGVEKQKCKKCCLVGVGARKLKAWRKQRPRLQEEKLLVKNTNAAAAVVVVGYDNNKIKI